jgi:hypothetical protein
VLRDWQSSIAVIRAAISWFTSSIGRSRGSFPTLIDSTLGAKEGSESVGGAIDVNGNSRSVEGPGEVNLHDCESESDDFGDCLPSIGSDWSGGGRGRRIEGKQPMLRVRSNDESRSMLTMLTMLTTIRDVDDGRNVRDLGILHRERNVACFRYVTFQPRLAMPATFASMIPQFTPRYEA